MKKWPTPSSFKPLPWRGACCPGSPHSSHLFTRSLFSSGVSSRRPAAPLRVDNLNPASCHFNTSTSLAVQAGVGLLTLTSRHCVHLVWSKRGRMDSYLGGKPNGEIKGSRSKAKSFDCVRPQHACQSCPEPSFVPASFILSSSGTFLPRHPDSSFILASNFCACLRPGALGILLSFASHSLPPSLTHPSLYPSFLFWHSARLAPSSPSGKTPTCYGSSRRRGKRGQ